MFGLNEALISFIRRQVGLRTDAASAGGSLHAKVVELRSYFGNEISKYQKPRKSVKHSSYVEAKTDYTTILNVSGRGKLTHFRIAITSTNSAPRARIVIDGTEMVKGRGKAGVASKYQYPLPEFVWTQDDSVAIVDDAVGDMSNMGAGLSFQSSLVIAVGAAVESGNIKTDVIYEIE